MGEDGSIDISWSDDDESENDNSHADSSLALTSHGAGNTSIFEASSSSGSSIFRQFVGMGFSEKMVAMALEENVDGNLESILETLLNYKGQQNSPTVHQHAESTLAKDPYVDSDLQAECDSDLMFSDDNENYEENLSDFSDLDGDFEAEKSSLSPCERSETVSFLVDMQFPKEEALIAIERCGPKASLEELTNFILAAQMARDEEHCYVDPPARESKPKNKKRKITRSRDDEEESIRIPMPMIGFGVPDYSCVHTRRLPQAAIGPPYFYFENVALAPKGVWDSISRHLFDVEPEFVDSKYFCAAARKRGYIHNLPIENRFPILPLPARTIQDVLPHTKRWWPSWDRRTHLNCLQTCIGSAKLTARLRKLVECPNDPPKSDQDEVLYQCRKWNLVWVGKNKVAPLEPDEVEMLLGFPKNHTRGISKTDRYKSLGNSFQVDTVAYHLSVLKEMFPDGIKVLSLFTGIGGGEVALHRLGIRMKVVVSVEISEVNQAILKSWWEQTNQHQRGTLIHIDDVQKLTRGKLEELMSSFGGFDLVIGGSPCNNLTGSNRHHRDGLEGKESSLFFEYCRILDLVKCLTPRQQ